MYVCMYVCMHSVTQHLTVTHMHVIIATPSDTRTVPVFELWL